MHWMKLLMPTVWLLYLPFVLTVKIGVSKLSTTTTTTTIPILMETATNNPSLLENSTLLEESTIVATTTKITTAELEFPPKKTTKNTTPKPTIATSTEPGTTLAVSTPNTSITEQQDTHLVCTSQRINHFYCACNLTPAACDINCCCDPDCGEEALKVFNCFWPSKYPELRLRLEDFEYEHGLPSCKINDGWFCVFRTNTRPPAVKEPVYSFDAAERYHWPSFLSEIVENEPGADRDYYKFGDPIHLIDENTLEIRNFDLPYAFKPPYCKLKEPIRHLMPVERRCLITPATNAETAKQELMILLDQNKLLSKPKNQITAAEDFENGLLSIEAKIWMKNAEDKPDELVTTNVFSNETDNEDNEENYIKEINVKILHNYTNLLHCQIEVKLQKMSADQTEETSEIWQKYSVKFIAVNATETNEDKNTAHPFTYSGPLGYLQGEPVIIAKFVASNESEEMNASNRILDFFKEPLINSNTLRTFGRHDGRCNDKGLSINYGVSSLHQCNFQMPNSSLPKSIKKPNSTEICLKLQQQILQQLFERTNFEDLKEIFVSILGHPQNNTAKWLPLIVENLDFSPVLGQFIAEPNTLVCRHILLSAAYEFYVGTFSEQNIANQALIRRAILKLGQRHDLEFTADEHLEVPLTLTVMFYDLAMNTGSLSGDVKIYFSIASALFASKFNRQQLLFS